MEKAKCAIDCFLFVYSVNINICHAFYDQNTLIKVYMIDVSVSSSCRNLHKQFIFTQNIKYYTCTPGSYPVPTQFDMVELSHFHTNK